MLVSFLYKTKSFCLSLWAPSAKAKTTATTGEKAENIRHVKVFFFFQFLGRARTSLALSELLTFVVFAKGVIHMLRKYIFFLGVGLYRTSHPVRKYGNLSKSGLSGNRTYSYLDTRLLKLLEIKKK